MLRGRGPHEPEFAYDIVRIHSLVIYTDLIEYNIGGDTDDPRSIAALLSFYFEAEGWDIITAGRYMNYQTFSTLQFRPLLKNSFHNVHFDLTETNEEKNPLYLSVPLVLFSCSEQHPTFNSNLKDVIRWLLQDKWRFHSIEVLVNKVDGYLVHLQKLLGELLFHFCVIYRPAAERVGADSAKFAAPETAEVVSGRKKFKTAAKGVEIHTLRKQSGSGSRRTTASKVIPTKSAKQISRSRRDIFTIISH